MLMGLDAFLLPASRINYNYQFFGGKFFAHKHLDQQLNLS